jgi:hypothetical protein
MKRHEQRRQATEASQRLERAEVRLSQPRADLYLGQVGEEQTSEQRTALALVEAALDTYMAFFYPPASSQ